MRHFVFIIGSASDFESKKALIQAYHDGTLGAKNASEFHIELAETSKVAGHDTLKKVAERIGFGEAFINDWCSGDTFYALIEE